MRIKTLMRSLILSAGTMLFSLLPASQSLAQYQVSQPGDAGPNSPANAKNDPANSPNRQPGVEIYGNNNRDKPIRYPTQTGVLPSELLIATQRSGALPSEIRANADAVGPLSSSGGADYIPALSPLQRAVGATPPVLFGPAWVNSHAMSYRDAGPNPLASFNQQPVSGERATTPEASPLNVTPNPVNVRQPINAQVLSGHPLGPITPQESTVSHPIHYIRPQTTQPTTAPSHNQPSLAPSVNPAPR